MEEVIFNESRLLYKDFVWLDLLFFFMIYSYLIATKRKIILVAGNIVGVFLFFEDYIINYFIQRSCAIDFIDGPTSMTSVEEALIFFWLDWVSCAGIACWALLCLEVLNIFRSCSGRKSFDSIILVLVPLWFWISPWLIRIMNIGGRLILTTKTSTKYKHYAFLMIFVPLLHLERKISLRNIGIILLSGLGCGLVHHAPLFLSGIKEYMSLQALVVTLLTDWPSIMCILVYFTHRWYVVKSPPPLTKRQKMRQRSRRGIMLALLSFVIVMVLPNQFWESINLSNLDIDKEFYKLLPYMSAQTFQAIGVTLIWTLSCSQISPIFRTINEDCFDANDSMRVVATTAQGGDILVAMLASKIGRACGRCVGAGQRHSDEWPGSVESNPDYPSDILLAMTNMRNWPAYVTDMGKSAQCVVVTRHPLARLRALYLYARNGREKWFIESGVEKRLDLPMYESVKQFIDELGLAYLAESHAYLMFNLDQQGCLCIKLEDIRLDFNGTMTQWLSHWKVSKTLRSELLNMLQEENPLRLAKKGKDDYVTLNKYSEAFLDYVDGAIYAYGKGSVKALIEKQARELGYRDPESRKDSLPSQIRN